MAGLCGLHVAIGLWIAQAVHAGLRGVAFEHQKLRVGPCSVSKFFIFRYGSIFIFI